MSITFEEHIAIHQNGAGFFTADLHIHSYGASDDVKDAQMTPERIVDTAVQRGIAIICLTDHNSSANTEKSIAYAQKAHREALLVLAGVEVTTASGHLLAYFAPDQADSVQILLGRLDLVGKQGGRDTHTRKSMADVIAEVDRLGGISVAAHIDRTKTGFEMLVSGYPNWKGDVISSPGLFGLEFDNVANLAWYAPEDSCPQCGGDRRALLSKRSSGTTAARVRLAPVQNSDAHSLQELTDHFTRQCLTRFKMDRPTFEGFRTAMIDPYARVRVEATLPVAIPRVLGMHIEGGFLNGDTYHFSDNLNCFIGGRGAGKSTAVRSLVYGLGMLDDFAEYDNCPDTVVVYAQDANGVRFRYERHRGGDVRVQCRQGKEVYEVSSDAFHLEFYAQNQLSEVAKDPLGEPGLLQSFLDKHIELADLLSTEEELLAELDNNSGALRPLEAAVAQLPLKEKALVDVTQKLQVAETGNVREIVAKKLRLSNEGTLLQSIEKATEFFKSGISFEKLTLNYDNIQKTVGVLTEDQTVQKELQRVQEAIAAANECFAKQKVILDSELRQQHGAISSAIQQIRVRHTELRQDIDVAEEKLRKQGLTASIEELNKLLTRQSQLTLEITTLRQQEREAQELREKRAASLERLQICRGQITQRRKAQVSVVNDNLKRVIQDYTVFLRYDVAGITDEFENLILSTMHGTYFHEEGATRLCEAITPGELAGLIRSNATAEIAKRSGLDEDWAAILIEKFKPPIALHALEVADKPLKPVITVLTKTTPQRAIPVNQLSDGQKHTIFLTIAMLAESKAPLVIDQPEDDLDNAFIFSSVVDTLRRIKEHRQVFVITHNANIAVLGDTELILPMKRNGDFGRVFDRGSIDRQETRRAVQEILEGGELAFRKRKEIYGLE